MSDNPTHQERDKYLKWMEEMSVDEEGNETISADLLQIYHQYVDTFRTQYSGKEFITILDQIKTYPAINTQYWKMFGLVWEQLSRVQQESLFERFAGMEEYRWLLDENLQSIWSAHSIVQPFLPKAYAVTALGILTDGYEPAKLQKATLLDDLMWIDYSFDLRDYDKVYRDIDGWGIALSRYTPELLEDIHYEYSVEKIESLLRCSVSLDEETKRRIILTYTDIPFENIQALVEILENEIKGCFMFESKLQNTQLAELVEAKRREWQEILNDYGRS
jgi:hypothetical protein